MTVSVTHAQQLSITTSTSNPVMPLTMLQQTSTGTTTSTSLTSSSSNSQNCTNNESSYSLLHNNINGKVFHTTSSSATTTSSFIVASTGKATTVLSPPLVGTTTTTITATTTTTSSPSSSTSSSSTTALRRLYFKTGRNAVKTRQTSSVPKVVVMGSSSTSEATINTSTESASTLVTNITATTDTDTTADSLDLGDTSGQSEPLLSSSLDDNPLTSITSESDSLEKDEIQSIVTIAEGNGLSKHHDNDSASSPLINYEDIPLHPYKTPQTAPLVTSTRFQFDPPQSPKSVRTFNEKNQTHFTFDDLKFKLKSKSSPHNSNNSSENLKLYRLRSHKSKKQLHDQGGIDADDDDDDIRGSRITTAYRGEKNIKNSTMFPFDREALDYERIQRECFACDDETSNGDTNMYYDVTKPSQKNLDERNYYSDDIRSPSEIFYQYTLLSQEEYQEKSSHQQRRNQKYHNRSYRKSKSRGVDRYELDHYSTISSPRSIISPPIPPGSQQQNLPSSGHTSNTPPLPDLRIDYFTELTNSCNNAKMNNTNTSTSSSTSSSQHDDLLATFQKYTSNNCSANSNGGSGPINVTPNPMDTAVYTQPRATIVVQQASLSLDNSVETYLLKNEGDFISVEQGKELRKKKQREENMRQLLDVTNTFTSEEIRDFEMRYGSPHHSRSQSVKTPGSRASGRPNQLTLPQQRSRVASMPNTGVEEEYYRLRHFSITGKGVINRGDSLKSRRSRSNNSVASSNSSTEHLTAIPAQPSQTVSASGSVKTSAACSLASSRESSTSNPAPSPYKVLMLGGAAVGKSSLVSQFMTSEYLHAYDTSIDDDTGEKSVSVLLSGEESELIFIDHPHNEMMPENCIATYDPHGYCVIYSSADKSSFVLAEKILQTLWTSENIAQKAVILVGNKADLARSRVITPEEGKSMATAYDCKFIETSVGINHNVDELLVGILSQIRLKLENPEKSRDLFRKRSTRKSKRRACSPLGTAAACLSGNGGTNTSTPVTNIAFNDFSTPPGSAHSSPRKYRGSRTSASLKVKGLLGRVWARDSKSKSCENLHVL